MNDTLDPARRRLPLYHLHLDDSGTRHLDRLASTADQHPRWFALGGVLVAEEDEQACKDAFGSFLAAWPKLKPPLHISDMLAQRKHFSWIEQLAPEEKARYWAEYGNFLGGLPVAATGTVIHRPGYRDRGYGSRAGDAKWNLCRTAFNIVVERSAKIAASRGRRLRVKYEGSDPKTDQFIKGYFALLKAANGLQFDEGRSAKYAPMPPQDLAATLVDLERKDKRSVLMQIADTYVYALARGRYEPNFHLYGALANRGRIIDDQIAENERSTLGVKHSCFDNL